MLQLVRKVYPLILSFFLASCSYTFLPMACEYPTAGRISRVLQLSDSINETSGLLWENDTFLTFNDSGGEAALYSFTDSIPLIRKSLIYNSHNADWEAMAGNDEYIYIADVGNNFGRRDTLQIYRIEKRSQLTDETEGGLEKHLEITAIISFSYDEDSYTSEKGWYSHDCEALLSFHDSLYLFAKDWVKKETRVYVLPAKAGHYNIRAKYSYPVQALITGADIDEVRREVVLVGYRNFMPVVIRYGFENDPGRISCGGKARIYPRYAGTQVEGVCFDKEGRIFISSEKSLYKQALYRVY
jgi:hypothetical protein